MKASRCCSTSSRRTARARVWPTRRSRRPTRATSRAGWSTWRRTSSSTSTTAARWTASRRGPSSRAARSSSRCATASSAARRSRRSPTRSPARRSSTSTRVMDEELSSAIQDAGIEKVKIRSVLTCTSRRGVCAKCYGRDLATGQAGRARPGRRRHRGAVDRRAGHAAHDADVPHRRHGVARVRSSRRSKRATPAPSGSRACRSSRRRTATWSS